MRSEQMASPLLLPLPIVIFFSFLVRRTIRSFPFRLERLERMLSLSFIVTFFSLCVRGMIEFHFRQSLGESGVVAGALSIVSHIVLSSTEESLELAAPKNSLRRIAFPDRRRTPSGIHPPVIR